MIAIGCFQGVAAQASEEDGVVVVVVVVNFKSTIFNNLQN